MPDLGSFAARIRRRARQVEQGTDRTVVRVAQLVNQTVVLATPVDTGRARANWHVSFDAPTAHSLIAYDQSGYGAVARNNAEIERRQQGQSIYIQNNLTYIQRLNEGHSRQAPAGYVELAVQAAASHVRTARVLLP